VLAQGGVLEHLVDPPLELFPTGGAEVVELEAHLGGLQDW
jgi:hypothetical protein